MVTIERAVPVLRVADVSRTIDWYRDVLGFSADPFPAKPPYAFAILCQGGREIFVKCADRVARDPADQGWDVYLRLRGGRLREVYADLRRRATVVRQLQK